MFILTSKNNNNRIKVVTYQENETVYLFKSNEQKFPLLSQIDGCSYTVFDADDMAQLIAELELTKNEDEINAVWEREEMEITGSITQLQIALKRYSRTMWSIEGGKELHQLQQRLQSLETGELKGQRIEDVVSHMDKIILLAVMCRQNTEYVVIHSTFSEDIF